MPRFLHLLSVASVHATVFTDFDDGLNLLQHRASEKRSHSLHQVGSDLDFGHEVKERPLVDLNECTESDYAIPNAESSTGFVCPLELLDNSLGARNEGSGVITGIRFYAAQAGNNRLRIRNYRAIHGYKYIAETEEIEVPNAGVIQEYSFKKPLPYLYEDWIGFVHNGNGNIGYTEDQPGDATVVWNGVQKYLEQPCWNFNMLGDEFSKGHGRRTYSYSFITRPAGKDDFPDDMQMCGGKIPDDMPDSVPDPGPPFPEVDAAAAVGDPHITQSGGNKFDMSENDLK